MANSTAALPSSAAMPRLAFPKSRMSKCGRPFDTRVAIVCLLFDEPRRDGADLDDAGHARAVGLEGRIAREFERQRDDLRALRRCLAAVAGPHQSLAGKVDDAGDSRAVAGDLVLDRTFAIQIARWRRCVAVLENADALGRAAGRRRDVEGGVAGDLHVGVVVAAAGQEDG